MSARLESLPADRNESVRDDLAGMASFFIDPVGAARRVHHKWFWIGPLLIFSILSLIASYTLMPMVQHVLETSPAPANMDPAGYQRQVEMGMKAQHIFMYLAPLMVAGKLALQAVVLLGFASVLAVNAGYRQLFNLVAGCSLIDALSALAGLVILKFRGDITSMAELRPALGLDIFLPEGTNKFVAAFLGYFSTFEVWWIVIAALTFSAAFRVTKGKALSVILPLVLLNLLFRLGATAFQRP